ncbi:MAG: insulinase family protein, partial [Ahrensia sp.]|nr:insulinase family protein [Ahrensia sp.]
MGPRLCKFLFVLVPLLALHASAQAAYVEVETKTALRGVWVHHDIDATDLRVDVVFVAGEADASGPEGIAHYLEHLMYWHADRTDQKLVHGRSGNAWVNQYVTVYLGTVPRSHQFSARQTSEIGKLLSFAHRLLTVPDLNETFMKRERDIVAREYDLRVVENPDRRSWDANFKRLAGDNPLGRNVVGTRESIASLSLEQAEAFHRKHYSPANMYLFISGAVNRNTARKLVEVEFGDVEPGKRNDQAWRRAAMASPINTTVTMADRYVEAQAINHMRLTDWTSGDRLTDIYT